METVLSSSRPPCLSGKNVRHYDCHWVPRGLETINTSSHVAPELGRRSGSGAVVAPARTPGDMNMSTSLHGKPWYQITKCWIQPISTFYSAYACLNQIPCIFLTETMVLIWTLVSSNGLNPVYVIHSETFRQPIHDLCRSRHNLFTYGQFAGTPRFIRWSDAWLLRVNTLRPKQNGRLFSDMFKRTFNWNVWISIKFSAEVCFRELN